MATNVIVDELYNMIGDKSEDTEYGLLAQDVEIYFPEMVSIIDDNNHLGLSYIQLIPILIEGFKEQQLLIEELQLKVKELENKLKLKFIESFFNVAMVLIYIKLIVGGRLMRNTFLFFV